MRLKKQDSKCKDQFILLSVMQTAVSKVMTVLVNQYGDDQLV